GYYVPIKGDLPVERIKELLDQTQAEFVLVQEEHRSKIADLDNIHQIHLDEANFTGEATTFDKPHVPDTNLAYIIFTSGSSGKPKGVMIDHRGAVNTLYDMNARFEVTEKDVVFGISDLNFDLSVYDIFGVLACGACLVLPEEAERQDPTSWLRYVGQEKVSVWNSVPQIAALLADAAEESDDKKVLSSLRLCWMSGDWIPTYLPDKLRSLSPKLRPISLGGATEASIWSIHYPINEVKEEWASIPYGMPLGNQQMYVLDDFMEPCPYGVVGNIFIGGVGVAKGYFKDEQKTAASFIPNEKLGGIIYRTGDMGCYHKDGYIVFLGRNDGQVKVRGFRIELGEIEHHLQSQKAIQEAIVMAKEGLSGSKELVAYVLVKEDLNKEQVYEHLRNQLPDYMVPAMIIDLKEFPMTSNGKVNRKALPEPDLTELMAQKFVAPRTDVERQLVEIWQKVLGHERIGIHDNFFQIGGDSIVSIRLIGKINKAFGCSFKIGQLYERSNIAAQAEWLEGHAGVSDEYEKRRREVEQSFAQLRESLFSTALDSNVIQDVYPLSDIQRGMSLLSIIHPDEGVYHNQYPYQIHKVDEALFEKALSLMVAKHDILRTGFDLENYEQELQLIHKEVPVVVDFVDLVGQTATAQKQFIDAYAAQERHRPFDFQKPPLWRASVFHIDDRQSIFFFQFHHAILDGWSLASFNTELFQIYMALKEDASFQLKPLTTSFRDSVIEERTEKLMPQSSEFWKTALADYKRLDVFSAEPTAVLLRKRYDGTFLQRLRDKSKTDGLSLQTVFFGAYAFALKMLSYEEDIVLGLVSNNRPMVEDADKVLGCFLNTLPVRIKFQEMRDISWIAYLKKLDRQ
ncbi:MAG: amino acid adenylation domain-containing protein, partial [Bacteroidota bacterium]